MSTGEIVAAVVSTVLVAVGGVALFISKQRDARRDQELRAMLQPRREGRLDLDSARTARRKGIFGIGGREDRLPAEAVDADDPEDDPRA